MEQNQRDVSLSLMVAFGIFIYFLSFCVYGVVLAVVLGAVLSMIGRALVPSATPGRRAFLWACFRRPFLLVPWILLVFVGYSYTNGLIFHRDNGIGVNGHAPLPDGYLLGYVNYNPGYFLTPETPFGKFPNVGPDTIDGVTGLQVAGAYVLGSKYHPSTEGMDDSTSGTIYFLLDTRTRSIVKFSTLDELRSASIPKGINPSLESPPTVYLKYRRTWFDWSLPLVSALGLAGLLASLWHEFKKIRHRSDSSQNLPSVIGE